MKILLAWMAKFVGDYGGTEKVCCHFAKEMTLRGHDVTIVYCTEKAGTPCEALPATISLRNLAENLPGKKWESARSLPFRTVIALYYQKRNTSYFQKRGNAPIFGEF